LKIREKDLNGYKKFCLFGDKMQKSEKELEMEKLFDEMLSMNLSNYYITFHPKAAEKYGVKYKIKPLFTKTPQPYAIPYKWDYYTAKKMLYKLAEYLTAEESERRTVIFVNPGLKDIQLFNLSAIAPTLYGGLQLIKTGEKAPAHRHVPVNLRLVLEAPENGAYIVYDGYKMELHEGDVLVQSNWMLHDHHNEGNKDLIWFAGLDAPFIIYLSAMFYEGYVVGGMEAVQEIKGSGNILINTYGNSLKPITKSLSYSSTYNPMIKYPFERVRRALYDLLENGIDDEHEGIVVEYINPITGLSALPTISLKMRLIKPKTQLKPMRKTEHVVYVAFSGEAEIEIIESVTGKHNFKLKPHDVVIIPPWSKYRIINNNDKPSLIFSYSDEPIFKAFGLYKEEKDIKD